MTDKHAAAAGIAALAMKTLCSSFILEAGIATNPVTGTASGLKRNPDQPPCPKCIAATGAVVIARLPSGGGRAVKKGEEVGQ